MVLHSAPERISGYVNEALVTGKNSSSMTCPMFFFEIPLPNLYFKYGNDERLEL